MDFKFTSEELDGITLKRNSEAANQEVRRVILEWISQDYQNNKDSFIDYCWKICQMTLNNEAIVKHYFPEGIDDNARTQVKNSLYERLNSWLQDNNVKLTLYLEFVVSSLAGMVQLAQNGQLGQETTGGQVAELFVKKYIEQEKMED